MSHPPDSQTAALAAEQRLAPPSLEVAAAIELPEALITAVAERAAALVLDRLELQWGSPYLTIPEAATYLRCKRQRIDDLLSARRLTRHKEGRRTLILRAELNAHINATSGPGGSH